MIEGRAELVLDLGQDDAGRDLYRRYRPSFSGSKARTWRRQRYYAPGTKFSRE